MNNNNYLQLKHTKEVLTAVATLPPAPKLMVTFFIIFGIGSIFYTFSKSPLTSLFWFSTCSFILFYSFYQVLALTPQGKIVVVTAFLISYLGWMYVFYGQYVLEQKRQMAGHKSFICNPNGICENDGTIGVHLGNRDYAYRGLNNIPSSELSMKNPHAFTLLFWLKVDYHTWGKMRQNKIVLFKESNLNVKLEKETNEIVFNVNDSEIKLEYPFDKWVHYTIVVNKRTFELYKNSKLEKSNVLENNFNLSHTPIFIGRSNIGGVSKFPGEMMYLTYQNTPILPREVRDIYQNEYSSVSKIPPTSKHHKREIYVCPSEKTCKSPDISDTIGE